MRAIGFLLALLLAFASASARPHHKSGQARQKAHKSHNSHRPHKSHKKHRSHKRHRSHKSHKLHTSHKSNKPHKSHKSHGQNKSHKLHKPHKSHKVHKPIGPKPANAYLHFPSDYLTTPAYRYGQLSRGACEAELTARNIPFVREVARGVDAPVRLGGPLHGVTFRGHRDEQERNTSPHEIADCRLVLALDDFARLLRRHDIIEVRHYSMYRLPPSSWPRSQVAVRHQGATAIDAGQFIARDGRVLNVDTHYHGAIGAKACGPGAGPRPATADATELRAILCEAVAQRLFNVVLTPNYDPLHKNHFHLGVSPGKTWFLVH